MKKYALHIREYLIVMVLTFTVVFQSVQAQEPAPSTWNSFINSVANPIVSDTFRTQTFAGKETDNWRYVLSGGAEVTNEPTLKMPLNSKIIFEPYSIDSYTNDTIGVRIAFNDILKDEKIFFEVIQKGEHRNIDVIKIAQADSSAQYKLKKLIGSSPLFNITVTKPATGTKFGYYRTNYIFAFGNIPEYSLFTGTGNWNDTICWSHLPSLRHRKALINGEITISANTLCKHIALNNGNIHLSSGTKLTTDNLILYNENSTLSSEGEIIINEQLTVHKTFEERGKWYFISFPFDVYSQNIDSRFVQKDATPNIGGNFFYVQTYNGDRRASSNQSSGNWEVLPIHSGNSPVFEKNKGYLIALDEKANNHTLTFSSKPGDIPSDFARNGLISIPISPSTANANKENYGWYLCGNPFPHPLVLSDLENTATLDGYAYIFQNSAYKAYPLNSDYAIPPYSAFFVKSDGQTEIKTKSNKVLKSFELIQPSEFTTSSASEPDTKNTTSNTVITNTTPIHLGVNGQTLQLANIPDQGYVEIFNITGHCLLKQTFQRGSSSIPLSLRPGVYLARLTTGQKQEIKKFILL